MLKELLALPIELPPKLADSDATSAEEGRNGKRKKSPSAEADGGGSKGEEERPAQRRKSEGLSSVEPQLCKKDAIQQTVAAKKSKPKAGADAKAAHANGGSDNEALHSSWAAKRALKEKLAQANFVGSKQTFDEDSDSEGRSAPINLTASKRGSKTVSRTGQLDSADVSSTPTTVASKAGGRTKREARPAPTIATAATGAVLQSDAVTAVRPNQAARCAFVDALGVPPRQSDRSRGAVTNNGGSAIEMHPSWVQRLQAKEMLAKQMAAVPQGQRVKFDDDSD